MGKTQRFLLFAGVLGAGTAAWLGWHWYKWSTIDWDQQDAVG